MSILRHIETPDLGNTDFFVSDFDYNYKMTDIQGMACTVYGDDDGPAYVEYWSDDMGKHRTLTFPRGEYQAYMWAYNHGYRE